MNLESKRKIYGAMSSLARYTEFKERKAPQILINQESRILIKYFSSLTEGEMRQVKDSWPSFYENRLAEDAVQAALIRDKLKREVLSIN